MLNLFPSLSRNEENPNVNHYSGVTISFQQLIERIKRPNQLVEDARIFGKNSEVYDLIKKQRLECFFANGYSEYNTRSTKVFYKSTGYIYLDFDGFETVDETIAYKESIRQHSFIAACWLSLSGKGISALVKVNPEKCNKYQYLKYWDLLNSKIFDNELDRSTRDFYRVCMVSSDPNIYVNEDALSIDTLYPLDYDSGLIYSSPIPLDKFESVDKPVVYPDGLSTIKLDFYKYRLKKIQEGKRNSTLGAISMQLIYLNPDAPKQQIINAMLGINRNYCSKPLSEKEVINLVGNNYKKKGSSDISKYLIKKYVFFHPQCKMPNGLRNTIRGEEMRKISRSVISNSLDNLMTEVKPIKVTVNLIAELTGIKKSTIYKNLDQTLRSRINTYNENQKWHQLNDTISTDDIYPVFHTNMRQMEKVSSCDTKINDAQIIRTATHQRIYDTIESLQCDRKKITQQSVAQYSRLSIVTIKRNWLPSFKELVKDHNDSLISKKIQSEVSEEEFNPYYRDILSPLPTDEQFEEYLNDFFGSKMYNVMNENQISGQLNRSVAAENKTIKLPFQKTHGQVSMS